jgi:putative ABC transport system ATP-binding protein
MSEPETHRGAIGVIGRGVDIAPVLRQGFLLTFLLAFIGAGARVVVPILLQLAIDHGLKEGAVDVGYVARLVVIGVVLVLVTGWSLRTAVYRLGRRAEQGLFLLRVTLFDHIHHLSLSDHNEERRGALVSRVTSDIETLQMFFSWGALAFLLDGTLMLMVAGVMVAYNWVLALVAFVVAMPLAFVLRVVQSYLVRAHTRTREHNAELLGTISEYASGIETLQAYECSDTYVKKIEDIAKERRRSWVKASILGAFLFPSGEVFSVLSVCGVVTVGVLMGPSQDLTTGAMIGFIFLTYRFLEPIAEFTEVLDQTQTAVAGMRRVLGILDTPVGPPQPKNPIGLPAGPLDIRIDDVSFSYAARTGEESDDSPPVLRNISLRIPAGQSVAIVGTTGSGKSTLGRLIGRFADPTDGVITFGGVDLRRVANEELRRRVVVVPQEPFLFAGTIASNIRFAAPELDDDGVAHLFETLDLAEWLSSLPEGLATEVGERGTALSAGERQLVALVRAAASSPDVLLLDEATSSVDALTEVRLSHALELLAGGRTSIAIAHRLSTAARADRVLVIEEGRLVEDGSHAELMQRDGHYGRLYDAWIQATEVEDTRS